jgi:ATP-dependent Lhr-like helicase
MVAVRIPVSRPRSPTPAHDDADPRLRPLIEAFRGRGLAPFTWQVETWRHVLDGGSGVIHAATGTGKTWAALGGALAADIGRSAGARGTAAATGPRLLWITPLRALASDTARAISDAAALAGLDWRVLVRNGDSGSRERIRVRRGDCDALVTTPESLALLVADREAGSRFAATGTVVVDEWHELVGGKRGVLLALNLERLRRFAAPAHDGRGPAVLGLSATLGDPESALRALLGPGRVGRVIVGRSDKRIDVDCLLPASVTRFPWAGHLGLVQLPGVAAAIAAARSTIVFTNTRAQAELWHEALASVWTDAPERLALHHGSLDRAARESVEQGLRAGRIRCVVATSSLDLGIDLPCVEQVIQIGSPKGVARLAQRAGRSGHRPGEPSRILCVPTHALELLDIAAARRALAAGRIEPRRPPRGCLDVLAQHVVTSALAGPIRAEDLLAEARATDAFQDLSPRDWDRVLALVTRGGEALSAYPDFRRVTERDGWLSIASPRIARLQRMQVGTIVADAEIVVKYRNGATLGQIEESFVARLKAGDRFLFAGRALELVRVRELVAWVRPAGSRHAIVPRWIGGRMPLSTELADTMRALLACRGASEPELERLRPLLERQARDSHLPASDELLVERIRGRDGEQLFVYPMAGRSAHEGLAALVAARLARLAPASYGYAATDFGFVVGAHRLPTLDPDHLLALFAPGSLETDLAASVNLAELGKRRFREIARVAGLVTQGLPGRTKTLRQLAASASLLHDVLREHEPDHLLLELAEREALERELDRTRIRETLESLGGRRIVLTEPDRLTPFAFPLWAERIRGHLSNEEWTDRVRRMADRLERRP